jgi:hypothetical protein
MKSNEQLKPIETEREPLEVRAAATTTLTSSDAEKMFSKRTAILRTLENTVSPLMHQAIKIKLTHEKEDLDALIKTAEEAEAALAKRRGVLDSRFFKKKSMPTGSH